MESGFTDTGIRRVRPSSELGRLVNFGTLENTNPILHPDGTVKQTVEYMQKIVRDSHKDVAKIADKLYDPKLSRFLKNIFNFVMTYVKYETDSAFTEQLRTPLRTLKDQKGDCDCMSILIGSILYNKNIPFYFRVSKYSVTRDFSHVYVIVPKELPAAPSAREGSYYVMDTVIKYFDREKPVAGKEDYLMDSRLAGFCGLNGIPIQMLNGVGLYGGVSLSRAGFYGLYGDIMAVTAGVDLEGFGLGSDDDDEMAMYNHLVRTRDVILKAPQAFKIMKNPLEVARMLDYAIRYWNTPQIDHVLGILENEEQKLLREGVIVYPHADLSGGELGELGAGFFKKIDNAVKKVGGAVKTAAKKVGGAVKTAAKAVGKGVATAAKAVGKGVATAAKAVGKGVVKAAKAVVKVVKRFNPVSLAARGGLLLAIRLNLFKLADKLQYGLYTDAQAQAAGLNMDDFHKMQESYNKAHKLFVKTLAGKEDKFKQAITKGVKHKAINGLGELTGLGDPASASIIATAMSFITAIIKFFTGKKNPKTGAVEPDPSLNPDELNAAMEEGQVDEEGYLIIGYDEATGEPVYPKDANGNIVKQLPEINTTAQPYAEQPIWQTALDTAGNLFPEGSKAGNFVNKARDAVNNFMPSGGGYDEYEEYGEYEEPVNQQNMTIVPASGNSSAVTASVMPGGMMSNIGTFIKKNAVMLGVGAVGIAGAVYFLTRRKRSSKGISGLSGITRSKKRKTTGRKPVKKVKLT